MSRAKAYTEKRAKAALAAIDRELDTGGDNIDFDGLLKNDLKAAAMGKGDEELFEKKLSKEEKKALAKAKREAKKKDKGKKGKGGDDDDSDEEKKDSEPASVSVALAKVSLNSDVDPNSDEAKHEAALEELSRQNIVVTYEQRKGNLHANTRDIKVTGVNVAFHGKLLVEETEVVINYGNRYGFIGPNGSGKVRLTLNLHLIIYSTTARIIFIHVMRLNSSPHPVNNHESHCRPFNTHPIRA
jgi:ABC-type glutathione transport system ATPase component